MELEPGIEGLVHVSEMSWTKRIKHPSKVVSVGDTVEAVVLAAEYQCRFAPFQQTGQFLDRVRRTLPATVSFGHDSASCNGYRRFHQRLFECCYTPGGFQQRPASLGARHSVVIDFTASDQQ